jgi:sugar lactone lactonase YvrE
MHTMISEYKVKTLSSQQLLCGEGPVWDKSKKILYWTEALGNSIYSHDQDKDLTKLHYEGLTAASLALHENGGLVATGKDGFSLLSPDKTIRTFENVVDSIHVSHLNDIIADPIGRVFGGQETFIENKEYEPGYLFRLDNNGEIKIVADGLHLANGMGFSPDGRTFYLVDTIPGIIYQFDYSAATGDISNKKVLVQFDKAHGIPDGMTIDKEGFLWVAMFFGGKIIRLNPDGDIVDEIRLPFMQPTSVTFGGKNFNKLFITTAGLEWKTATYTPEGHNYDLPKGGSVLVVETDFEGIEEFPAKI